MKSYASTPKSSFKEDIVCGFLGGAMAGFNVGLWVLPHAGLLSPGQTLLLCSMSGVATALLVVRVKR